jgi:hypothetical protein
VDDALEGPDVVSRSKQRVTGRTGFRRRTSQNVSSGHIRRSSALTDARLGGIEESAGAAARLVVA